MSRLTALITSGIFTLFLVGAIGAGLMWNARATDAPPAPVATDSPVVEAVADPQADYQAAVEKAQASMTEREAQYQTRLSGLEQLGRDRAAQYQTRLSEADAQLAAYDAQIKQVSEAAAAYQAQIGQLEGALGERAALFDAARQELETQRQARLGQLQAQLSEGQARLQEANAQLGR